MAPITAMTFLFVTHSFSSIPFIDFLLVCVPSCLFLPLTFRVSHFCPSLLLFVSLCWYFLPSLGLSRHGHILQTFFFAEIWVIVFFFFVLFICHNSKENQEAIYQTFYLVPQRIKCCVFHLWEFLAGKNKNRVAYVLKKKKHSATPSETQFQSPNAQLRGLAGAPSNNNWHLASWCGFMSLLLRWWLQLYLLLVRGDKEVGKDENSPLFKTDHPLTLIFPCQFLRQGAHPSWFTSSKQLSLKVTILISPHRSHLPVTIPFICPISLTCSALFPSPLMLLLNVN